MYNFTYTYNLAGALTSETYPSGRVVTTGYDGANRAMSVQGTLGGQSKPYATNVGYWPHGGVNYFTAGNHVVPMYTYNNRLQINEWWATLGNDPNHFFWHAIPNWGGTNNNGNLYSVQEGYGANVVWNELNWLTQNYTYDGVNRLSAVADSGYTRSYCYDAYGNGWVTQNSGVVLGGDTPQELGAACPNSTTPFNGNNQMNGIGYDNAGNQTSVKGSTVVYDAENRQVSVTDVPALGGGTETYAYDGNGQRVWKSGPGGMTVYAYDAFGVLAAEYTTGGNVPSCSTCYLTWDHLGTPRLITDPYGNVVSWHDYLPFGEEVPGGTAGRSGEFGASDNVAVKFTGQYRDSETGEDYFNARYFTSTLGRFNSPDPLNASADLSDPQTWNGYAYVRNNPLAFVDPSGMDPYNVGGCWFQTTAITTTFNGISSTSYNTTVLGCDFPTGGSYVQLTGGGFQNPTSSGGGGGGGTPPPTTLQPAQPPKTGNLGLTNRQACYSDALVNGALGFIPGYNAAKTVASLVGFNFNPVQFINGNTGAPTGFSSGASPVSAGSPTVPQIAAGVASAGAIYADGSYAAAGGSAALSRAQDLISRGSFALKSASAQANLLQNAASLERLAQIASVAKNLGTVFNLASTAFDLYRCSQQP